MRRCVWGMRRCVWDEEKQVTQEAIKREEGRYKSKVIASFCGVGFIFQLSLSLCWPRAKAHATMRLLTAMC
jgi:hypothetical protein